MIGIIALVNENENSAVLVDKNKKQYSFDLDDCVGFDTFPEVGEKVEFDFNGNEIFFVEALKSEKPQDIIQNQPIKENVPSTQKKSNIELHVDIPLDCNISDCLTIILKKLYLQYMTMKQSLRRVKL